MKSGKRWLFYIHRWLGVTTCLLSVMWFLSGLVMLYVPFPAWSDEQRIETLPPIAGDAVKVLPDEALARSGLTRIANRFPAGDGGAAPCTVSLPAASTSPCRPSRARRRQRQRGRCTRNGRDGKAGSRIERVKSIDYDQWTVTRRYDPHRPLYRLELGDGAGTNVYVSSRTGEIVQDTTRGERAWNWLGAVPHWIYFAPLRKDADLWHQVVIWLSGPMAVGAIAGMWIGILRLRPSRAAQGKSMTPHRGWMKWHHLTGLIGGLFLVTWIASGWLSMNPFKLFARTQITDAQRAAYAARGPTPSLGVTREALYAAIALAPSELAFAWIAGTPVMVARNEQGPSLLSAGGCPDRA